MDRFMHNRIGRCRQQSGGFTLIELMVSLSLFAIVMTVSIGTLLVIVDVNAKAQALYSAGTNLSFALDSVAREIRTGYEYYCGASPADITDLPLSTNDCTDGEFIAFTREEDGTRMGYRLSSANVLEQKEEDGAWTAITARDVFVEKFAITADNTDTTDSLQPTVKMGVTGYVNNGLDSDTDFQIQTKIVQRRLDLP